MIIVLRAGERQRALPLRQEVWHSFPVEEGGDPLAGGFGAIEDLQECHLPPRSRLQGRPTHDAEVLTYVRQGALAYEDSTGRSGVLLAGEFQTITARSGVRHQESNASRKDWTHLFQIWLRRSEAGLEPLQEQRRFSVAQRRGRWCLIASPDGREGSLRVNQDVRMCAALLEPGRHVLHDLPPGHRAWLHLVQGEATLGYLVLGTGDGAGIRAERAVALTAREESEVLLFDLGETAPGLPGGGGAS